jgi:hypothetical protein
MSVFAVLVVACLLLFVIAWVMNSTGEQRSNNSTYRRSFIGAATGTTNPALYGMPAQTFEQSVVAVVDDTTSQSSAPAVCDGPSPASAAVDSSSASIDCSSNGFSDSQSSCDCGSTFSSDSSGGSSGDSCCGSSDSSGSN